MTKALSPTDAQTLIAAGNIDIVDVREPNEWATGHLPGARLVPLSQVQADAKRALPRDNVLLVCQRGQRSLAAAKVAEAIGLSQVYSLDGGTAAWAKAGLPIDVPKSPRREKPSLEASTPTDADAPTPSLDTIVGENVRILRTKRGMTLDAVAKLAGVSRTTLGQIEIGRTVPSVNVVWKIARAFDVPFSTLLATTGRATTSILRKAQAKRLVSADSRFSSRALFPFGEQTQVEFYELWLAPHGREEADAHQPGTRENLVVTSGRLEIEIGAERLDLGEGDAVMFAADVPHVYVNPGNEACWMHLVMSYTETPR